VPVLDTDVLTIIQRRAEPGYTRLVNRLNAEPGIILWTTVISFEEQLRGWLAYVKSARITQLAAAYQKLLELNEDFSTRPVLPFDTRATAQLEALIHERIRRGIMDLKIAAVALAHSETLISKNLKDFRKVRGLLVEDWTI
jgi:tRNA(fMet)-specific endonuclease VapC